eukprot:gnl/MRDRNA2_/MRDRNA2_174412_c0_seq1.p1 gnl/MRDRNA2_/MRDRNA2_174412_c0~~gnl/MRDRNA2_/MRDRNA2_174412_c0_seq1.p1  ORF type:complete len:293 (-),score=22.69 gnl/MRDRNA2_/MRDRNA2_174412_c0_seq1:98-976(-)
MLQFAYYNKELDGPLPTACFSDAHWDRIFCNFHLGTWADKLQVIRLLCPLTYLAPAIQSFNGGHWLLASIIVANGWTSFWTRYAWWWMVVQPKVRREYGLIVGANHLFLIGETCTSGGNMKAGNLDYSQQIEKVMDEATTAWKASSCWFEVWINDENLSWKWDRIMPFGLMSYVLVAVVTCHRTELFQTMTSIWSWVFVSGLWLMKQIQYGSGLFDNTMPCIPIAIMDSLWILGNSLVVLQVFVQWHLRIAEPVPFLAQLACQGLMLAVIVYESYMLPDSWDCNCQRRAKKP